MVENGEKFQVRNTLNIDCLCAASVSVSVSCLKFHSIQFKLK